MDERMLTLLENLLGDRNEAMVPVVALYDLAGEAWLPAANEAALRLNARVERPDTAAAFALIRRNNSPD